MQEGGRILATILNELKKICIPGKSTLDIDKKARELFNELNAVPSFLGYRGFPASVCTAINEEVVHGIPHGQQIIKQGDIVSVDCGVLYKGYHTDSAFTICVGNCSPEAVRLVKETEAALWEGIKQVKPGNTIGDISHAIYQHLRNHNITVIDDLVEHGIGKELHEAPQVPNIGKKNQGPALKPGMTIAIEPITCLGKNRIVTIEDDWTIVTADNSLACQQEHTVLVTKSGYEVLTVL